MGNFDNINKIRLSKIQIARGSMIQGKTKKNCYLQGYYDFQKATIYRATRSGFRLPFILIYMWTNIL
jgi:hypothetical protein